MNILSEAQATTRQLALPRDGLLADLSAEFIGALQSTGVFVEFNQQAIVSAGEQVDYVSCIVAGRAKVSRLDADYARVPVARLGAGEWIGESNIFARVPSHEEIFADGETVIWTVPTDTLRSLFFRETEGAQLLFNIATRLAQKLSATVASRRDGSH